MMMSRRKFAKLAAQAGFAAVSAPLWMHETSKHAFAQLSNSYKAIVVITLVGGNDGNNMLIPLDSVEYQQYASLRPPLALSRSTCNVLSSSSSGATFGLHPALRNVASLYNSGKALVVANVGPLARPATKAQLLQDTSLIPEALLSHPAATAQWESASTVALPSTGWGGRIADLIVSQSGSLPPVLNAGPASIFTVGNAVQGIVVQGGRTTTAFPAGMVPTILAIAENDSHSSNLIVAEAAKLRSLAMNQQALLTQAQSAGSTLKAQFPNTAFGVALQTIASTICGRSVIGASRQIFYCQQGNYDTHANQLGTHNMMLSDLDSSLEAFIQALGEMGLEDQVLICTHSDFNRTMVSNGSAGSDHAWANHQLVIGGGIRGGRIIGNYPDLDINGSLDLNGYGTWLPTLSATQMTAGIGAWMGLSSPQLATVFPDLGNFPDGAIGLI